ncbi:spermatid maturation protein 1 [Peromyscus maniculatus bairdii]|uniref:Spermatid maturation 1 n=1 Tax=Peromyscus maniculatus bairdii TaxID=230844 RepID=A0A6I9KYF1_PERMB|nr:spermatid maturation protein 1 isoform X2 [Peromyscus maniculatus bairdii]
MAMAERSRSEWDSYQNPNSNNCQDVGNSILILLGLIICINIGINLVTLLWSRLRIILHQIFHIICEKETTQLYPPGRQIQPLRKQTYPEVHLRCTMDPMKMTVTPPPTRRHRRRASQSRRAHRAHRPTAWAPDTDEERSLHQCQAICSRHWDGPKDWESFQPLQEIWEPWTQDGLEQPPQTIRFQPTVEGRPLKTEIRSEQGLEAYVYTVNPPPPNPEALSHKNNGVGPGAGAEGEQAPCQPASPTFLGPANIPEIPRRRSSGRIVYDARDVRRRLRELTREVEALSHCYPLVSGSSTVEGTSKDWVYRPLKGR